MSWETNTSMETLPC